MNLFRTSLLSAFLIICTIVSAQQPTVDITLVDNGGSELEVRVRPDGPFDGIFSALLFTIRWNAADGADLGAVDQTGLLADDYMPLSKSGDQTDANGDRYQIFAGFGFGSLASFGANWEAGMEYTLMTIPVLNGSSAFQLVNDSWTDANNGDFFISLGGVESTGIIYSTSVSVEAGANDIYDLNILPNPNNGNFTVQLDAEGLQNAELQLVNALGQVLFSQQLNNGQFIRQFDLTQEGQGVYFLRLENEKEIAVHRIVVE